jgi:3-hydroxyisobutyrate dehydrogenase-like beta-hydroxyacid dehydrogenase
MTEKLAFVGYGEAARAFRASLGDRMAGFSAYDLRRDDEMRRAMAADGVEPSGDPGAAIDGAAWIFSAVTADQSLAAARSAAPFLKPGQVYVDINSVSPDRKRVSAAAVAPSGATYLDMAVMAPVHPRGHATPVLIAGPDAARLAALLEALGFDLSVAGAEVGAATAVKMVRSLFVKGLEAITVEALLAAEASGCLDTVLESLSRSYPGLGWPEIGSYHLERTLRHGGRRAAEMEESAATLAALGLHDPLAAAIAGLHARMGAAGAGIEPQAELRETLRAVLAARRSD